MTDYKATLNLPKTDFPMKADLAKREPTMLKFWQEKQIFQQLAALRHDAPKFILHDGPPYANGHIHIGHALDKVLKDIINKSKFLDGFNAPYVPGWDCHGLPIELNVEKTLGKAGDRVTATEFRKACRDYAYLQMNIQREEFKRLGVLGDWENPYLTMDFSYEAEIIRSMAKIVENGHLHRGSKPVHWCVDCGSALAEAEVEYQDKTSPAIDVRFKVVDEAAFFAQLKLNAKGQGAISLPIWTTTPWTLPANEAVTLRLQAENESPAYVLVQVTHNNTDERLVVAKDLLETCLKRYGIESYSVLAELNANVLEHLKLQHPFLDKQVPIILGQHVTFDTGTGAVHTAPAHGEDDYIIGLHYHLPVTNPVNDKGCFKPDTPLFAGEHVFKANNHILEVLQANNALLHAEKLQHSYPHCWRHKIPLIFRATPQWFISMDQRNLREDTLLAIQKVSWLPEWGQARIEGMISQRPDWCISRQRIWGTPLTLFLHKETGELHPDTLRLMHKVAEIVEQKGIDAWYELAPETLLGDAAQDYQKSMDVLDVWLDSGVSHACVMAKREALAWPADVYIEGSDQYRGWFQSSLLTSMAMNGKAPYRTVITHGFTVDGQGRKMSKSLGNVIAPEKIWDSLGADILRLWVAATDYRGEISLSDEILKRLTEVYRRIRNTARYLLSNLFDFNPSQHLIHFDKMVALDRWAIAHTQQINKEIISAYDQYNFHVVMQKIQNFCSIEMGSFYLDIIKDRQYTAAANGHARRSAQTAMYYILENLVRWLAPILSFTAEEIWQAIPWKSAESVFFVQWCHDLPTLATNDTFNFQFWEKMLQVRDEVNRALEKARIENLIGAGLEAQVMLYVNADLFEQLTQVANELRFIFITSDAKVCQENEKTAKAIESAMPGLWIEIIPSPFNKCARCWHRREEVGQHVEHTEICQRCVDNISTESGEQRFYA